MDRPLHRPDGRGAFDAARLAADRADRGLRTPGPAPVRGAHICVGTALLCGAGLVIVPATAPGQTVSGYRSLAVRGERAPTDGAAPRPADVFGGAARGGRPTPAPPPADGPTPAAGLATASTRGPGQDETRPTAVADPSRDPRAVPSGVPVRPVADGWVPAGTNDLRLITLEGDGDRPGAGVGFQRRADSLVAPPPSDPTSAGGGRWTPVGGSFGAAGDPLNPDQPSAGAGTMAGGGGAYPGQAAVPPNTPPSGTTGGPRYPGGVAPAGVGPVGGGSSTAAAAPAGPPTAGPFVSSSPFVDWRDGPTVAGQGGVDFRGAPAGHFDAFAPSSDAGRSPYSTVRQTTGTGPVATSGGTAYYTPSGTVAPLTSAGAGPIVANQIGAGYPAGAAPAATGAAIAQTVPTLEPQAAGAWAGNGCAPTAAAPQANLCQQIIYVPSMTDPCGVRSYVTVQPRAVVPTSYAPAGNAAGCAPTCVPMTLAPQAAQGPVVYTPVDSAPDGPRAIVGGRDGVPEGTYVGQGIIGQPKAYVEGQPIRNFFRYFFP